MVEIRAPQEFPFLFALPADGPLRVVPALQDPRRRDFAEREVILDLRACAHVGFPAALWCIVYLSLAQRGGAECLLRPPERKAVADFLRELGVFAALRETGVAVDETESAPPAHSVVVLPITRFTTTDGAQDLAMDALARWNQLPANLRVQTSETFGELANNAAEHANSLVGAFGLIQFYRNSRHPPQGWSLACAVADGGVGIRGSLQRNASLRPGSDVEAIELAMVEQNSATCDPDRGFGFTWVSAASTRLTVHSGNGVVVEGVDDEQTPPYRSERDMLFPGVYVAASVYLG